MKAILKMILPLAILGFSSCTMMVLETEGPSSGTVYALVGDFGLFKDDMFYALCDDAGDIMNCERVKITFDKHTEGPQ